MLRKEVVKLELIDYSKLYPYVHWILGIVYACEPIWQEVIAKDTAVSPVQLDEQLQKIPFDAPESTKMALREDIERIGFSLAPAFPDMRLKLAPESGYFYWMADFGALAKGTEKLMDKLHHYLYMDLKDQPSFPPAYSNVVAMRGMMAKDYGAIRSLLWAIGEHDTKAGFEIDLLRQGVPPQLVMNYDAVTDNMIRHDFFHWAAQFDEFLDVAM